MALTSNATGKETTYDKQLFDKALSEGKLLWSVLGLNIVHHVQVKWKF